MRRSPAVALGVMRFADLSPGEYIAAAFHESVNPPEATQKVTLAADELLQVRFIYLEPERQLLRIFVQRYPFDMGRF